MLGAKCLWLIPKVLDWVVVRVPPHQTAESVSLRACLCFIVLKQKERHKQSGGRMISKSVLCSAIHFLIRRSDFDSMVWVTSF